MSNQFELPPRSFLGVAAGRVRNDVLANGTFYRNAIARQVNHIIGLQTNVCPGKNLAGRTVRNTASALRLWTAYMLTPSFIKELVVDVQLIPTDTTAGSPRWWVEVNGVSQGDQFHNVRCSSGSGTNFADIFEMQQVVSVGSGFVRIDLWTDDNCRVVGWDLHQKPRNVLGIDGGGTIEFLDFTSALPLSSIRDTLVADTMSFINLAAQDRRGVHLCWNVDDPASPIAVSSTVAADTWGASTAGPTAPTQYRNSYLNDNLLGGIANRSIQTRCWVLGERTAGAGNVIGRFVGDNHAGGVDVNVNGALGIYTVDTFTLKPQAAGDCIRLKHLVSAGGTTGNIYAAGCFPIGY